MVVAAVEHCESRSRGEDSPVGCFLEVLHRRNLALVSTKAGLAHQTDDVEAPRCVDESRVLLVDISARYLGLDMVVDEL